MHLLSKDQLEESYTSTWSMNVKLIIHVVEGVNVEDLPECPDHQISLFLKGKPWSILSLPYFLNVNLSPFMLMH